MGQHLTFCRGDTRKISTPDETTSSSTETRVNNLSNNIVITTQKSIIKNNGEVIYDNGDYFHDTWSIDTDDHILYDSITTANKVTTRPSLQTHKTCVMNDDIKSVCSGDDLFYSPRGSISSIKSAQSFYSVKSTWK